MMVVLGEGHTCYYGDGSIGGGAICYYGDGRVGGGAHMLLW